jgi:hypothetical protein
MQSTDPSVSDFAPGTSENPQAGKFATTAALQAKASDSVTADTLDQVNMFVRDCVELQLWMDQQAMDEDVQVPKQYFERIDAVSLRTQGGQARYIKVSPMDEQEDYEVLPEAGSTLAANDEFRVGALQQFAAIGEHHPDIINMRNVITKLAQATPGVNPEDVILPPPPPTPPVPPIKASLSLAVKWEQLPADVQAELLQNLGLPTTMTHVEGIQKGIESVRKAADDASELERPVDYAGGPNGSSNGGGAAGAKGNAPKRHGAKRTP